MKQIFPMIKVGIAILVLVGFILVLNLLFQSRAVETGTRQAPTGIAGLATPQATRIGEPTPKPTKKAKVDWADATLDQVKFGKARPILTHQGWMRIWSWLPDNRRLLLDLEDPEAKDVAFQYQIVTLDTKTGEIVEYGHRPDDLEPPVWIEETQNVVFRYWNSVKGEPPEVRVGYAGGDTKRIEASGLVGISARPTTDGIYYLLNPQLANPLRMISSQQSELSAITPFESLELPTGKPRIDPNGQQLAIIGRPDLPVLDLSTGELHTFQIADFDDGKPSRWAMNGEWSPSGTQIGLILNEEPTGESSLPTIVLGLLRFENSQTQVILLPAQFIKEFD